MAPPPEEVLSAGYALEYTYTRSVGPAIGRFLTGLRERRIEGVVGSDGRVIVPPTGYD
ncbi:MAG: DNA-binding protein, partial [Deltaproteobacteria bacterium]|nr:DNA-binding protein [Deltaproteobacteria bacterium]